uniref:Uncharacterized protein n=1 Tax=Desertifilum tharense IPPAS B-1220 TaxID=1781255 RepID=A0ACD5GSK9_9CYAN
MNACRFLETEDCNELFPSLAFDEIDIDTSYEPFSREPEYIEANRLLIEELPLQSVQGVLDLVPAVRER